MENKKTNNDNNGNDDNDDNDDKDDDDDYDDYDDDDDDILPYSVRSKHSVATKRTFKDVEEVLLAVLDGQVNLRRLEGTRIAHISSTSLTTLFIDGEEYPLPSDSTFAGPLLCDNRVLTNDLLKNHLSRNRQSSFTRILASLLRSGLFYPVDV